MAPGGGGKNQVRALSNQKKKKSAEELKGFNSSSSSHISCWLKPRPLTRGGEVRVSTSIKSFDAHQTGFVGWNISSVIIFLFLSFIEFTRISKEASWDVHEN